MVRARPHARDASECLKQCTHIQLPDVRSAWKGGSKTSEKEHSNSHEGGWGGWEGGRGKGRPSITRKSKEAK